MCTTQRLCSMKVMGQLGTSSVKGMRAPFSPMWATFEYELDADGKSRQSERGEALRHPFTGVPLALECGVPDASASSSRPTPRKATW